MSLNTRYKGLRELHAAQQPADAVQGQATKKGSYTFYPATAEQVSRLLAITGIENQSMLIRAALAFADRHPEEFADFLVDRGVKVG